MFHWLGKLCPLYGLQLQKACFQLKTLSPSIFHSVVNALKAKHIEKVTHVLMITNTALPYTSLKQALIKSFEASDNFKMNKVLSLPALDPVSNSKCPTELLQEM